MGVLTSLIRVDAGFSTKKIIKIHDNIQKYIYTIFLSESLKEIFDRLEDIEKIYMKTNEWICDWGKMVLIIQIH